MNKLKNLIIISICLFLSMFLLTSCSKKYVVEFIVDEIVVETQEVKKGKTATEVNAPSKTDYIFMGWYDGESKFDFSTEIKQDYELVAKYVIKCTQENHTWENATCTTPKTCSVCNQTEGEPLEHTYTNSCDTTCDVCSNSRSIEHTYSSTCDDKCNICETERTGDGSHEYSEATHDAPATCQHCGKTIGEKIPYASKVVVDATEITLYIDEEVTFTTSVLPAEAPQGVSYTIRLLEGADATIDQEGKFIAKAAGTVYVTVRSTDNTSISTVIIVNIIHPLLEEEVYDAYNIMTGFGTDASTQIEINYHTHNTKTFVEYTLATDTDFSNYSTISGTGYYFTHGTDNVEVEFDPRNVYRVSITDLNPNTEYIYRINKGNDTYSDIYKFKTAPNEGGSTSFFIMSDTHYATKLSDGTAVSHGSEISEEIIKQALSIDPNIGFIATAGDVVDTGGNADMWNIFFNESQSLKSLARIGVAGNHEYYINGTTQSDGKYQKAHYATPYNGPSEQLGLSCYYKYNDILFIIVDNERTFGRTEMLEWLENVLATNESKYSFVMMHTPVYYERDETSNQDRDEELLAIFEKYSVDMVLAGHYHGDRLRTNYYQGADSTDPGLGVNYMTLSFSGVKSATESNPATGYIFNTNNGVITITRIRADGTVVSTRTITSKRNQEVVSETKENLIASINPVYDSENGNYIINFTDKFYGNVKQVNLTETNRNLVNENMFFPTPSYNKLIVKSGTGINKLYDHHFVLTIEFIDGTEEVLEYDLNLSKDLKPNVVNISNTSANINFDPADSSLDWIIKDYVIYVNGVEYSTIEYLQYDMPITSYYLLGLTPNTEYNVKFVARNYQKRMLFSFEVNFKTAA